MLEQFEQLSLGSSVSSFWYFLPFTILSLGATFWIWGKTLIILGLFCPVLRIQRQTILWTWFSLAIFRPTYCESFHPVDFLKTCIQNVLEHQAFYQLWVFCRYLLIDFGKNSRSSYSVIPSLKLSGSVFSY